MGAKALRQKKKKVLVIGYGGTIVMIVDEKTKSVKPAANLKQVLALLPRLDEVADISMEILSNKDSTNVTPDDWTRLALFLYNNRDAYDAFVITHGTNTMAYTASALTLALGSGFQKPVVLTGSQLPLTVYGNDARFNFENSIKVAVEASNQGIAEVMVVFSDVILRGGRTVKVSESAFDAFKSPAFPELGVITSTGIHFSPIVRRVDKKARLELNPNFSTNIVSLDLTPGQLPSMVESFLTIGKCKGLILKSHGAGSVPTEGEYSFISLIQKAVREYKIPVIVSTKFLGGNAYKEINDECAVRAIEAGAIPGGDLTDVMTEVKLMWILAQGAFSEKQIHARILTDYVGEVTEANVGLAKLTASK
ncbi:MAG: asparaginase [Candidatus Aenigmarchaeota archaeon]|nr:asparaginase [Candidatus Aenigmarchaeota archaeon]